MEKFPLFVIIFIALLVVILIARLSLRVSAQWRMLKKNWTWKDEIMDTLFYAVILTIAVWGLSKLIYPLPY